MANMTFTFNNYYFNNETNINLEMVKGPYRCYNDDQKCIYNEGSKCQSSVCAHYCKHVLKEKELEIFWKGELKYIENDFYKDEKKAEKAQKKYLNSANKNIKNSRYIIPACYGKHSATSIGFVKSISDYSPFSIVIQNGYYDDKEYYLKSYFIKTYFMKDYFFYLYLYNWYLNQDKDIIRGIFPRNAAVLEKSKQYDTNLTNEQLAKYIIVNPMYNTLTKKINAYYDYILKNRTSKNEFISNVYCYFNTESNINKYGKILRDYDDHVIKEIYDENLSNLERINNLIKSDDQHDEIAISIEFIGYSLFYHLLNCYYIAKYTGNISKFNFDIKTIYSNFKLNSNLFEIDWLKLYDIILGD